MRPEHPPVTVAMIVYNQERYVAAAIGSILEQKYQDFELVIVDDGSTDRTAEVVRSFADARIRYHRQHNQGPSVARNTALALARGNIVAQMSGDDVSEPDRLTRQLALLDDRSDRVVFSEISIIDDNGRSLDPAKHFLHTATVRRLAKRPSAEILHHMFHRGNCVMAPTAVARRDVFLSVGGYDPLMLQVQDMDMWTRLLIKGVTLHTVPSPLLRYRLRSADGNLSARTPATRARLFFEARRVLEGYRNLGSVASLRAVFPEIDRLGYPVEEDFLPLYLGLIGIGNTAPNQATTIFGGDLLVELMRDATFRERVGARLGFGLPDLFRVLGTTDPWAQRTQDELTAQLEGIVRSPSWRLTRPLRVLLRMAARPRG